MLEGNFQELRDGGMAFETQEANKLYLSGEAETYKTQNGPSHCDRRGKQPPEQETAAQCPTC